MVKIKISYESPEELQRIMQLLEPLRGKWKLVEAPPGKYKRAYVQLHK